MTSTQQSSTKQDILQYLLKKAHARAQDLAVALDISPQAIRRHLKDLETQELIEHKSMQIGMGRPQYVYQLSRKGHDFFPNRYGEFAVSLLDVLSETVSNDQISTVLEKQWQRKAQDYRQRVGNGSLQERVSNLVNLRRAEGYMAEYHILTSEDPDEELQLVITEHNCAISQIAESFPRVCDHELEMFAAALENCSVERTHWINNGEHECGYLISGRKQRRQKPAG